MKKKQLVLAMSTALALSAFHPSVSAITVDGGPGMEITYDDTGVSSLVELSSDLAKLDKVTVAYLPINVIAILTPELIGVLPVEAIPGLTTEQIAELSPAAMAGFSPEQIEKLSPYAISGLTAEQVAKLSLEAVAVLSADQLAKFSADAVSGFTVEQFKKLSLATLKGLNTYNMAGLSGELIELLGLDLLVKLDSKTFKDLPTGDLLWFLINLNPTLIKPADVISFLPTGWYIDLKSGKIKFPREHKIKLKLKKVKHKDLVLPVGFSMPIFANLTTSFTLGGVAIDEDDDGDDDSIADEIDDLLEEKGFGDFAVEADDDTGIIKVSGGGVKFSFIVDMDEVELLEEGATPDLVVDDAGNFELTTLSGLKLTLLTAPKDPLALFNLVPGGELKMDKKGNIKLKLPNKSRPIIGTLDPVIVAAPSGATPGITLKGTPGVDEVAQIVYEDGTMQLLLPSVTDDIEVTWSANFYGTGKIKFRANGHIHYTDYLNALWSVVPSFEIMEGYSVAPLNPYYTWIAPNQMLYVDKRGDAQVFYWKLDK
jgi:hypothetical protein